MAGFKQRKTTSSIKTWIRVIAEETKKGRIGSTLAKHGSKDMVCKLER